MVDGASYTIFTNIYMVLGMCVVSVGSGTNKRDK